MFQGTTLRSMLLEAYGFWQFGQIALMAAWAAFTGAALMLILSLLGLFHLRRTAARGRDPAEGRNPRRGQRKLTEARSGQSALSKPPPVPRGREAAS